MLAGKEALPSPLWGSKSSSAVMNYRGSVHKGLSNMVADRSTEFNEIIDKLSRNCDNETSVLRQRTIKKQEISENENANQVYEFSKAFLTECTMTVITITIVILAHNFRMLHWYNYQRN